MTTTNANQQDHVVIFDTTLRDGEQCPGATMTFEEKLQVAEILDGELFLSPRPASRHARATSLLGSELTGAFDRESGNPAGPGGWWILDEPELHFGSDVVVPDIAGWRRERMPRIPDAPWFDLAPDWLCETLSPSTARIDRTRKLAIYAREGIRHVWLVDPMQRSCPAASAGLRMLEASIAPPLTAPAPTRV